jgi:hypothetical protein
MNEGALQYLLLMGACLSLIGLRLSVCRACTPARLHKISQPTASRIVTQHRKSVRGQLYRSFAVWVSTGWSSFKFNVDDVAIDIGPFACSADALDDIARAALMPATSDDHAEVGFDGATREWRLIIDTGWRPKLRM